MQLKSLFVLTTIASVVFSCCDVSAQSSDEDLLTLASNAFSSMTMAEIRLFQSIGRNQGYICGENRPSSKIEEWKEGTLIRADRIRWLLTNPKALAILGTDRTLYIKGAGIANSLYLIGVDSTSSLIFEDCVFTDRLYFTDAHLKTLIFNNCWLPGIDGYRTTIDSAFFIRNNSEIYGSVNLNEAYIGGGIDLSKSKIMASSSTPAIDLNSASVVGNVIIGNGITVNGEVRLVSAYVNGTINFSDGKFVNTSGDAINCNGIKLTRSAFLRGHIETTGGVNFGGAIIDGQLECSGKFNCGKVSGGVALELSGIQIAQSCLLYSLNNTGGTDISRSRIKGDLVVSGSIANNDSEFDYAIYADDSVVDGSVMLGNGIVAMGSVSFGRVRIGGSFIGINAQFKAPHNSSLNLNQISIGGSLLLKSGVISRGKIDLIAASIDKNIEIDDGDFENPQEAAFVATDAHIGGSVVFSSTCIVVGDLKFALSKISGNLIISGVDLSSIGRDALDIGWSVIGGSVSMRNCTVHGTCKLRYAQVGRSIDLDGTKISESTNVAISGYGVDVGRNIQMRSGFSAEGAVIFGSATVDGNVDTDGGRFHNVAGDAVSLNGIAIRGGLYMRKKCSLDGGIDLINAEIHRSVELDGSYFNNPTGKAINAYGARIGGIVSLKDGFKANGEVSFDSANIGGHFVSEHSEIDNPVGSAISLNTAIVHGAILIRSKTKVNGTLDLIGAKVDGQVSLQDSIFINVGKQSGMWAVDADAAAIGGHMLLSGAQITGGISLSSSTIAGNLNCEGMKCSRRSDGIGEKSEVELAAVEAGNISVHRNLLFSTDTDIDGGVNLSYSHVEGLFRWRTSEASSSKTSLILWGAKVGTYSDDPNCWPNAGRLHLHGFQYDHLSEASLNVPIAKRIYWLRLQYRNESVEPRFMAQPYRQLAQVLRNSGYDGDAKIALVACADDRLQYGDMSIANRIWQYFLRITILYGYNAWRVIGWMVGFIIVGYAVFHIGKIWNCIKPTEEWAYELKDNEPTDNISSKYPKYSPLIFCLDEFIPLVNLHQTEFWTITCDGPWLGLCLRLYLLVHIIAGWTLTTIFALGLSGLIAS